MSKYITSTSNVLGGQAVIDTLNGDDFRRMAEKSPDTGIISVSDNLHTEQVDSKLTALLVKSSAHALQGKFTTLTGET
jgi:hypothetical protein